MLSTLRTLFPKLKSHLIIVVVLSLPMIRAEAQTCPSQPTNGCPTYDDNIPAWWPQGAQVDVISTLPAGVDQTAVTAAIADWNLASLQQGWGIHFSFNNPPSAASNYYINFDTTSTHSTCGSAVACTVTYHYAGSTVLLSATTTVFLAVINNPPNPSFNPSNDAAFQAAVQGSVSHEMGHTTGVGDSPSTATVMGPFVGQNNADGTNFPSNCDYSASTTRRSTGATGSGGTCP